MIKTCNKCAQQKPVAEFYKNSSAKDGLRSTCKQCHNNVTKPHRQAQDYKSYQKGYMKVWQKDNKHLVRAASSKRRSVKLRATPSWLSESQFKDIQSFYWLARDLETISGQKYHVDHVIPLKGKGVCGLHVPWNLQILPADLNISKSNKI